MLSLLKYEIKKFCSNRILPFMLIAMILLNVWLVTKGITEETIENEKTLDTFLSDYNADPEGMEEYMAEFISSYQAVTNKRRETGDVTIPYPDNKYTVNDFNFFSRAVPDLKNLSKTYKKAVKSATRIANSHIEEYMFLGFDETSFEIKYQRGVIKSYEKLSDIEFPMANVTGYDILLDYSGFGVIAMIAMLVGGMLILIPEKSSGMEGILRVSKRGRHQTFAAKMITAFLYALVVCVLLSLSAYIAVAAKIGYSGGELPIQMVDSFKLCPIMTTVAGGVALSILLRFFACFAFLCIIIALSGVFSSYVPSFGLGILFVGINYALANFKFLNDYDAFKNLNFFWSINGKEPLVYWRGIKLFGACVPTLSSLITVYSVLTVAAIALALWLYVAGKGLSFRKIELLLANIKHKAKTLYSKIKEKLFGSAFRRRSTLVGFEMKKVFTPFAVIILIAVLLVNGYMAEKSFNKKKNFYDLAYAEYMEQFGGEWTEEKDGEIKTILSDFSQIISQKETMDAKFFSGEITGLEYGDYYNDYNYASNRQPVIQQLSQVSDALRKLNDEGKMAYFVNETGWAQLKNTNYSYIYLVVIVLLFSNIFALEYKDGFFRIQNASRNSKKAVRTKLLITVITCISLVFVCELYQYLAVIKYAGLPYPEAPAVSLSIFKDAGDISIAGKFFVTFLRQILVASAFGLFTAALSRFTKKLLPTIAISAIVAFAPMIFNFFGFGFMNDISLVNFVGRV